MNILYIAHRIPFPPNKGDKIRSYHQIKHLSQNHNLYLACLIDDQDDFQYIDELKKMCCVVETAFRSSMSQVCPTGMAFVRGQALSTGAFYSKALQQKIEAILGSVSIDRIITFSSPMAEYVRTVGHIPKLMDFVDLDSEKWGAYAEYQPFPFAMLYRMEARRLRSYEVTIANEFDQSVFISSEEAEVFRHRVPGRSVAVVPNGVDLEFFSPSGVSDDKNSSDALKPTIVFTAAMDYFPNIDGAQYFCDKIFPRISDVLPEVSFVIVGRKPTPEVLQLARTGVVDVTGTVPDVRPYLARASMAVAPLRIARGVQNKILEAMAMGLPVVGTGNAFQGIGATTQDGIRICDDPMGFADEVIHLLRDKDLRRDCGQRAREFVSQRCRWEDCGTDLEALVHGIG